MKPTARQTGYLAVTAVESGQDGIGYWAGVAGDYDTSRWWDEAADQPLAHIPSNFIFYHIEVNDSAETFAITPALIRRGFDLAMRPDADVAGWALRDQLDTRESDPDDPYGISCLDAIAADVIIQHGCFGRLIYG